MNSGPFLRAPKRRSISGRAAEVLAIPSISTDPDHNADMRRAAEWMAAQLRSLGMAERADPADRRTSGRLRRVAGGGHRAPTVMLYGHYDVQPPDPLELWTSPPFEPEVRGDYSVRPRLGGHEGAGGGVPEGRGVDRPHRRPAGEHQVADRGRGGDRLGESGYLHQNHKELLACDFCFNADAGILAADEPSITTGLRGLAYFELRSTARARTCIRVFMAGSCTIRRRRWRS